jgi:hypothetical protein
MSLDAVKLVQKAHSTTKELIHSFIPTTSFLTTASKIFPHAHARTHTHARARALARSLSLTDSIKK